MSGFFSGSLDPNFPHALLLSVAIVASFAVAIGIVMENPKWSLANALVVGGVAIEAVCTLLLFGFDEGISSAQQSEIGRQNSEIIALRKNSLPRSIDLQAFAKQFVGVPPARVEILYVPVCTDCWWFASWLADGLNKANWSVGKPIPIAPTDRNLLLALHSLYAQSWGVTVVINSPDKITADPKSSLGALNWALASALGANFGLQGSVDVSMPADMIRVVIAPKA
jgi:hypothetical protein